MAAAAIPASGVSQPDEALLDELFNELWQNLGAKLGKLVQVYRSKRQTADESFRTCIRNVFSHLDEGPGLPSPEEIATQWLKFNQLIWNGDRMYELRVKILSAFEDVDKTLEDSFSKLRQEVIEALSSSDGGRLETLLVDSDDPLRNLAAEWRKHEGGEVIAHAIEMLLSASLSFRGFIQPRLQQCLDVLDCGPNTAKSAEDPEDARWAEAAKAFVWSPGDTAEVAKTKLELAWQRACYECRPHIEAMAAEPSMARFAAIADFRDTVWNAGGSLEAFNRWRRFYRGIRADVWQEEFGKLEGETRLRKAWDEAVALLGKAADSLSNY